VDGRQSADHRMIAYLDMSGQRAIIRKNDRIAHGAVMSDVAVGQKIAAISHLCFTFCRGAPIDGGELAKAIVISDLKKSRLALIF
jgi:hypothetical protein